jgi:hypothetical protein
MVDPIFIITISFSPSCLRSGVDFRFGVEVKDIQVSKDDAKPKVTGFNLVKGNTDQFWSNKSSASSDCHTGEELFVPTAEPEMVDPCSTKIGQYGWTLAINITALAIRTTSARASLKLWLFVPTAEPEMVDPIFIITISFSPSCLRSCCLPLTTKIGQYGWTLAINITALAIRTTSARASLKLWWNPSAQIYLPIAVAEKYECTGLRSALYK